MGVAKSATGRLEHSGDIDWLRVKLTAGQTYEFLCNNFNGGTFLDFRVILPGGEVLQEPIRYLGYANFTATVSGDYFIAIGTLPFFSLGSGFYSLTVYDYVDPILASAATTRSLAVGTTETVTYTQHVSSTTKDWFAIDVVAGQSYVLNSDRASVYFANAEGQVLAIEGLGGGGPQAHYTATATGRLYAGVQLGGGTSYKINLAAVADDHSDTVAGAGSFAVGTPVNGRWEAAGDDDAYVVSLTAGMSYTFAVPNLNDNHIVGNIRIYDQSGTLLQGSNSSYLDTTTVFSAASSGDYLVVVGMGESRIARCSRKNISPAGIIH